MLVLTRKLEESIMIGHDIEVQVLGIHGDQVKLGFAAPRSVSVFRKEVFEAIQAENRLAAKTGRDKMDAVTDMLTRGTRTH